MLSCFTCSTSFEAIALRFPGHYLVTPRSCDRIGSRGRVVVFRSLGEGETTIQGARYRSTSLTLCHSNAQLARKMLVYSKNLDML